MKSSGAHSSETAWEADLRCCLCRRKWRAAGVQGFGESAGRPKRASSRVELGETGRALFKVYAMPSADRVA
jgi:hypothetical protein